MSKKAIFLLLLPIVIFLQAAGWSFHYAKHFAPDEKFTQSAIDKLTREAQDGVYGPSPDLLVKKMSDSFHAYDGFRSDMAGAFTIIGWIALFGVAVQVYLVLRLRFVFKKHVV
jgi:hypothetical protein